MNKSEAMKRLTTLFDNGEFTEIDAYAKDVDGNVEVVAGFGCVNGETAYAFSQDVTVNDGAISLAQCAKIKKIYELAKKTGNPVIGIYDSNGVKLTEGFETLSAYGELVKLATSLSGVVAQYSIIAGSCVGTSALIANMADIVVAVKDADFYISAPSEIEVSDSSKAGIVDVVADSYEEAVEAVKKAIVLLPNNNLDAAISYDPIAPAVKAAAGMDSADIVNAIATPGSVLELKAGYSNNSYTALASVGYHNVGIIALKGNALCPSCCYKAEALIKLCDAYNLPIITIVNSNGIKKNDETRELIALTKLTSAYATATSPKISVVVGEAIGSAYIVLAGKGANADVTIAWDNAVISPLDVEASVAFLYNDRLAAGENRTALETEYKETLGSAFTAAACGAIDDVIAPAETASKLVAILDMLSSKRETTIPRKHSVK